MNVSITQVTYQNPPGTLTVTGTADQEVTIKVFKGSTLVSPEPQRKVTPNNGIWTHTYTGLTNGPYQVTATAGVRTASAIAEQTS
jgi:hypothetical protein